MKPSIRQRICIPPRVCFARSRNAWIAVSALPAQIWTSRSPPQLRWVEVVVRERPHRGEVTRLVPWPGRTGRRTASSRRRPSSSGRRAGRPGRACRCRRAARRGRGCAGRRRGEEPRAVGHRVQQVAQLGTVGAATMSKAAKQAAGAGGVVMPAWWAPWNGTAGKRAAGSRIVGTSGGFVGLAGTAMTRGHRRGLGRLQDRAAERSGRGNRGEPGATEELAAVDGHDFPIVSRSGTGARISSALPIAASTCSRFVRPSRRMATHLPCDLLASSSGDQLGQRLAGSAARGGPSARVISGASRPSSSRVPATSARTDARPVPLP